MTLSLVLLLLVLPGLVVSPAMAALPTGTTAAMQPGSFDLGITDIALTCETLLSLDLIVINSAGYTSVEAGFQVQMFDDEALFEANNGGAVVVESFPEYPGSFPEGTTPFAQVLFANPSFLNADSFFLRIDTRLVGRAPVTSEYTEIREVFTTSVTDCGDDEPTLVEQLIAVLIRILQGILNG